MKNKDLLFLLSNVSTSGGGGGGGGDTATKLIIKSTQGGYIIHGNQAQIIQKFESGEIIYCIYEDIGQEFVLQYTGSDPGEAYGGYLAFDLAADGNYAFIYAVKIALDSSSEDDITNITFYKTQRLSLGAV